MEIQNPFAIFTLPFTKTYEAAREMITPKSHAEATVDQIYGPENRGLPMPEELTQYFPEDSETPQAIVQAKQAVKKTVAQVTDAVTSTTKKYLIIGGIVLAVFVFVYAFAGGLARRV